VELQLLVFLQLVVEVVPLLLEEHKMVKQVVPVS
jgi:hypothetical protein